jgi:hypothetical protein
VLLKMLQHLRDLQDALALSDASATLPLGVQESVNIALLCLPTSPSSCPHRELCGGVLRAVVNTDLQCQLKDRKFTPIESFRRRGSNNKQGISFEFGIDLKQGMSCLDRVLIPTSVSATATMQDEYTDAFEECKDITHIQGTTSTVSHKMIACTFIVPWVAPSLRHFGNPQVTFGMQYKRFLWNATFLFLEGEWRFLEQTTTVPVRRQAEHVDVDGGMHTIQFLVDSDSDSD